MRTLSNQVEPRPTIYDVAAAAGVSHASISRYFNELPGLSDATRRRIGEVVERLGYEPNAAARALAHRRGAEHFALVVDASDDPLVHAIVRGFRRVCGEHGIPVDEQEVGRTQSDHERLVARVARESPRGIATVVEDRAALTALAAGLSAAPLVAISAGARRGIDAVWTDARTALAAAVDHLVGWRHRETVLTIPPSGCWGSAAYRAAAEAANRTGILSIRVIECEPTADGGFGLGDDARALAGATAVIAWNHSVSVGLLHALVQRGIAVPEQVSVVALHGTPDSEHLKPPLTVVDAGGARLGAAAAARLLEVVDDDSAGRWVPQTAVLTSRESSARRP